VHRRKGKSGFKAARGVGYGQKEEKRNSRLVLNLGKGKPCPGRTIFQKKKGMEGGKLDVPSMESFSSQDENQSTTLQKKRWQNYAGESAAIRRKRNGVAV